jgi:type II secretory pathway pseudopilin PulG
MKFLKRKKGGYTIIETMIAISLFIIIVMMGMGALLNANLLHKKSQNLRSIIDNLSFVLEDMSRNLRTGYNYHCISPKSSDFSNLGAPQNGDPCGGIAFEYQNGNVGNLNDQWVYFISNNKSGGLGIFKSIDGGSNPVQLTPDEIDIDPASFFSVFGAEADDGGQPFASVKLSGKIIYNNIETPFSLRTSVSQRALDIEI